MDQANIINWEQQRKIAEARLASFKQSRREPLTNCINNLRRGDILCRGTSGIFSGGKNRAGEPSFWDGMFKHFVIYAGTAQSDANRVYWWEGEMLPDRLHRIIEKTKPFDENDATVSVVSVLESKLRENFCLLVDQGCRYQDTADMAEFILGNNLDGGYNASVANCEHFVTFCLTRDTSLSHSSQSWLPNIFTSSVSYKEEDYLRVQLQIQSQQVQMTIKYHKHKKSSYNSLPDWCNQDAVEQYKRLLIGRCWQFRLVASFPN